MSDRERPSLSDLETKAMDVIWRRQQANAEHVRTSLEADPPLKDSTVRTVLRRLEEKGYVSHHVEGRTYVYSPVVDPQSVAAEAVRDITQRFCDGSVEDLLVGMVNNEMVSAETLKKLAEKVSRATKSPQTKPRRTKGA